MNNCMINPSIVDLLEKAENRYNLVTITSKRARQLIAGDEPLVDIDGRFKPLTIAINELNEEKVTYESLMKGIK